MDKSPSEVKHSSKFGKEDGWLIISGVRESIHHYLESGKITPHENFLNDERFAEKCGCFVTLKSNSGRDLRGCIGFPEPIYQLSKALTQSAIAAATEDPRFPSLKISELPSIITEVSILTKPEIIKTTSPLEYPQLIKPGIDGLILRWAFGSGLLLPQVAREFEWNAEEFLSNLSMKAGAPPDQWLVPGTELSKFRATIFEESFPNGPVNLTGH